MNSYKSFFDSVIPIGTQSLRCRKGILKGGEEPRNGSSPRVTPSVQNERYVFNRPSNT